MPTNRYTNVVLTVIAACLIVLCLRLTDGTPKAHAQLRGGARDAVTCLVSGKPVSLGSLYGTATGVFRGKADGTVDQLMTTSLGVQWTPVR